MGRVIARPWKELHLYMDHGMPDLQEMSLRSSNIMCQSNSKNPDGKLPDTEQMKTKLWQLIVMELLELKEGN